MQPVWFVLVALMLTAYVVLDGFDLGAGALQFVIGRTEQERSTILRTIGPVWDGNEVWLLAAGGTLYFAFPLLYASSFSGFYLPLNVVLWLFVLRGIGVEFRMHLESPLWRALFDGLFSLSSGLLIIFFGAALGNVIRGVPLAADYTFFEPLWTDFLPGSSPGILDWYTIGAGVLALAALAMHGALYIALKTDGAIRERACTLAGRLLPIVAVLTAGGVVATAIVRPATLSNFSAYPVLYAVPLLVALALGFIFRFVRHRKEFPAFASSCTFIAAVLVGAAAALYPALLPSADSARSIDIYNASSGPYALRVGLIWWTVGMLLAVGYFVFVYRTFRGKVGAAQGRA
jgi:cytochrome d ubiquinol oxidase subunit II